MLIIASCSNTQKIIESLQSRFLIIKIKPISNVLLKELLNKIVTLEKINIDDDVSKYILTICNNSIRMLINYLENLN